MLQMHTRVHHAIQANLRQPIISRGSRSRQRSQVNIMRRCLFPRSELTASPAGVQILTIPLCHSRPGVAPSNLLDMFVFAFRVGVTVPGEGLATVLSDIC